MHSGVFPKQLKTAKVLPVHKAGDINDLTNYYHPISILPISLKIFEKLRY